MEIEDDAGSKGEERNKDRRRGRKSKRVKDKGKREG